MSTVAEIEDALRSLPIDQARSVADWLQDYLEDQWDRQIERDAASGKLEKVAGKALEHYKAGRLKPLEEVVDNPSILGCVFSFAFLSEASRP